MNIVIMVLFLAISLTLLVWAFFFDKRNNTDPNGLVFVKLTGWLTAFLVFSAVLVGGVQYPAGAVETVAGNVTTIQTSYETYSNRAMSLFLTIMSGIGFIMVFYSLRGVKQ